MSICVIITKYFSKKINNPHEKIMRLAEADSKITKGIFEYEIYQWYGSAALPEYLEHHKKIEKTKH